MKLVRRMAGILVALSLLTAAFPSGASAWALHQANFTADAVSDGVQLCYGGWADGTIVETNKHNTMQVIEVWEEYSALNFFNNTGLCGQVTSENISVWLGDKPNCNVGTAVMWTLAGTLWNYDHADIWINDECWNSGKLYFGTSSVPAGKIDGPSALAHEVGHALGICHSNETEPGFGCETGSGNGIYDLMDVGGPQNADCTEGAQPFQGRRIIHASWDDKGAINTQYPSYALPGPPAPPESSDCVS